MEKCFFLPGLHFSIARCMRSFYFSVIFMPFSVNNNPQKKRNWLLLSFSAGIPQRLKPTH